MHRPGVKILLSKPQWSIEKNPKGTNNNINIRFERRQMKGWSVH